MSSMPYQYSGVETLIMAAQLDSLRANAAMSATVQVPSSIQFQNLQLYPPTAHHFMASRSQDIYTHHLQPSHSQSTASHTRLAPQPNQSTPRELLVESPFKIPAAIRRSQETNQIPTPRNKSELELFHVLKQANLLDYYQTFIKLGGDDLEQLAEAEKNEEEFLEIVQLVGMNTKPLHVRRFQKAVRRWREDRLRSQETMNNSQLNDLYYDTGCNVSQDSSFRSEPSNSSSILDESIAPTSTASRSLFPAVEHDRPYCTPPHQIIKNAPKRPRLMDSIKPSDLTKGIQLDDSAFKKTPRRFSNLSIDPIRKHRLSILPKDGRRQRGTRLSPPDSPVSQASYPNSEISQGPHELEDETREKKRTILINKRKRLLKKPSPTNLEEFYNIKNPVQDIENPLKSSDPAE